MTAMTTRCRSCGGRFNPEQVAAGLSEHVHHARQATAISAVTRGPCAVCRKSHTLYGPAGTPLCDDCTTAAVPAELPDCPVCGLPVLPADAPVDGCHPTCIVEDS